MTDGPPTRHPFDDLLDALAVKVAENEELEKRIQVHAEWVVNGIQRDMSYEISAANERLIERGLHLEIGGGSFGESYPYTGASQTLILSIGTGYGRSSVARFTIALTKDGQIELQTEDKEVFATYSEPPEPSVLIRDLAHVCRAALGA